VTDNDKNKLRDLLHKLFAQMGTDNEHESQVAQTMIRELLKKHNLSWNDALELITNSPDPDAVFEDLMAGDKQSDILINLAKKQSVLFRSTDGRVWAVINVGNHRETWPVRSSSYKHWLRHRFWDSERSAPGSEAIETAVAHVEASAYYDGAPTFEVFNRIAAQDDKVYLDLADDEWTAIEIDADRWRAIKDPPVRFCRTAGMAPLPIPQHGGSLSPLRDLVNVNEEDFVLVVAWLLAALRGKPPYPALAVSGVQGSAKSGLMQSLRDLIDPSALTPGALPHTERDLVIGANARFVQAFDNLSGVKPEIADALCRLTSGGGFAIRALYTDDDERIFSNTRPVLLAGVEDVAGRHDLADRTIALVLAEIPEHERKLVAELQPAFARARPLVLGRLLDIVAHGLRALPTTKLRRLPRMADLTHWMTACETAEWGAGTFAQAYARNRAALVEVSVEADVVAAAVLDLVRARGRWSGSAKALLTLLNAEVEEGVSRGKEWPKTPRALSGGLRRASAILRASGVEVTPPGRTDKARIWAVAPRSLGSTAQTAQPPKNGKKANDFNGGDSGGWPDDNRPTAQPTAQTAQWKGLGGALGGVDQPPDRPPDCKPLKNNGLGGLGGLGGRTQTSEGGPLCAVCEEGGTPDNPLTEIDTAGNGRVALHTRCEGRWFADGGRTW
jgi:hypothetical protein